MTESVPWTQVGDVPISSGSPVHVRIEKSVSSRHRCRHSSLTAVLSLSQVYGIRTRSRAVEIFTTCAHMICTMEELEKVRAFGSVSVPPVGSSSTESSRPAGGDPGPWGLSRHTRLRFLWLEPYFSQSLALLLTTLVPQSLASVSWPSRESE